MIVKWVYQYEFSCKRHNLGSRCSERSKQSGGPWLIKSEAKKQTKHKHRTSLEHLVQFDGRGRLESQYSQS